MMNWGSVKMKGKTTKKLGCLCCVAFNGVVKSKNSKVNIYREIEHGSSEYSTNDYPNVVNYFEKKGVVIEIIAEHPCNLDVIFDKVSGKWLGYVDDFCLLHEGMYCEKCFYY